MANNTSTFTLKLKTEGMDQAQAGSKQIRENLEGAQRAATRVARSAAAQPTGRAGASAGVFTGSEVEDYNRASGAAGRAGGTARDFADQARGLGGLVRLYATVAANAFAAAAAFGALSRAMDTTNMVKGLDQLGAASGVALGNLSKRLFLATDGAVSLREAMEATAKATGAGLNSDQILKLGEVAKKASQTLGVNMTDALSRLSRGVTKLEPELLDELGIFIKIDDAASKYALSVGKSTSALTDFERRQAFANAVIDQGIKKFGEVNIDINPYTKLAATFQNLTQTLLEFVNKGLAPIAQIFADNAVLLGAAFAFIATKVLKMAIPALGEWQGQLVKTANVAKEKAQAINTAFGEAWVERWETRLKLPELRAGVKTATEELKKMALPAGVTQNVEAGYAALLRGENLSKGQVQATKIAITDKKKQLEALGEVQDRQGKKQKQALEVEISKLERIIALNKQRQALALAEGKIETAAGKDPGFFSGEAARNRTARGASTTAIALAELAAVPGQTMEKGFGDAMKNMKANLEKQGVGFVKRWSTLAVGALASATTAIGAFVSSIQMWIGVFMAVGFAIYGALKHFSATKKESELTSEAITRLEDASKSAVLTLEKLAMSKDPLESLNVQTIQAKANALKELGESAVLSVKRAFDEISKMNAGDQFLNWISKLWGGDVQTKLSKGLADSIKNAFKLAEDTQLTDEAKKSIEAIVGTSVQSADLDNIIRKLAASGQESKLKEVVKILENMGNAAAVSAAKGTELRDSFGKVTTGIQEFNRSLAPTDNLSKIAQDSAVAAQKLAMALNDPVQALTAMKDISGNIDMLSIFPADVAKNLMSYNTQLVGIANNVAAAKARTAEYDKEIQQLNQDIKTLAPRPETVQAGSETEAAINAIKAKIQELESKKIQLRADITTDTSKVKGVFDQAVRASLIQSAEQMAARLSVEMNKARTAVISTIAALLGDTAGGIRMRAQIEKQAIDANIEATQQSFNLGTKMEELKVEMERKRLQDERLFIETKKFQGMATPEDDARADQIVESLKNLDKLDAIIKGGFKGPRARDLAKQGATPEMIAARQRFEAFGVTIAGAKAQKQAVDVKTGVELERNRFQQSQKDFQLTVDAANIEKQRLDTLSSIYGIENLTLLNRKLAQENAAQDLADTKQRNELQASVNEKSKLYADALEQASKTGKALSEDEKKNFSDSVAQAQAEVNRFNESVELRKKAKTLADDLLRADSQTATDQKKLELQNQKITLAQDLQQITLDSNRKEFEALNSIGAFSEEYAAKRTGQLAKEAQQLQVNKQLQDAAAQKALQDLQAQAQARKAIAGGMDPAAAALILEDKLAESNSLYTARVKNINDGNSAALRSIDIETSKALEVAKTNKLLEDQKERADTIANIGELLSSTFGKAGTVIKGVVDSLEQISVTQENFNQKLQQQNEIQARAAKIMDDPNFDADARADAAEAYNKAEKEKGKLVAKNTRDEMVNNTKLVGSVKNMFKEKTAAYKIFNAFERAMHVYTLTMDVAKVASGWMVTTQKLAQAKIQAAAQAAPAGASAAAQTPGPVWVKIAAGLAAVAFVMSLVNGGKGGSAPTPGTTAADRQETQGTGMSWVDGKKVETGGGVFGDAEAKTDPIRKSLEKISETSVDGIFENRKMVKLLQSIDRSIGNAAKGLFSIPGLRTGSAFGTVEGTNKSGGILGLFSSSTTKTIQDSGLVIEGTFRELAGQVSGGVVKLYEDVVTTTKKWYGRTKSSLNREFQNLPQALEYINDVFSNSGDLFVELGNKLAIGKDKVWNSLDTLGKLKFEGSLRGLKGDELNAEVQAIIGNQLDKAAISVFGAIVDKFKEFGESALETVIRIVDETEKGLQALGNISAANGKLFRDQLKEQLALQKVTVSSTTSGGLDAGFELSQEDLTQMWINGELFFNYSTMMVERLTTNLATAVTETITRPLTDAEIAVKEAEIIQNLAKEFGNAEEGFENFLTSVEFFREKFLTEAERLAPIEEMVTTQLSELGLGFVNTRDEFKGVIQSLLDVKNPLGVLTKGGQELLGKLLLLAPAFDEVYKTAQSAALSVEEFSKKVMSNEVDILKMQASLLERSGDFEKAYTKLQESILITRNAELIELEKLPEAQKTVLKYQLEYKWSLEDLASQTENNIKINNQLIASQQSLVTYLDEALGLVNQAVRLRGEGLDAQYIERTIALQNLSAKYSGEENAIRLRVLTGLQKYIWALEDEQTAKDNYVKALQEQAAAIQREVDELQKTLAGYDKLLDQKATIAELTAGTTATGKLLARERELRELRNQFSADMVGTIIANQEYIWALEDESDLKDKLVEAYNREKDAIESTIDTIKDAIKSIKDYRNSLTFSSELSVLTPEQQYKEARKIFEQTLTAARTVGVDEAGVKAQQEALSKIPEVSNKFLELSRTLFASSGSYMTDYQVVQNALNMTEAALGEQLTEAEQQLSELKIISESLDLIEENTRSFAEILLEFQSAQRRTEAAASAADSRSFDELQNLRNNVQNQIDSKLAEIKNINNTIAGLGERQLTAAEAAVKVQEAASSYQLATSNSSKILSDISGDVNNGTIAAAINTRAEALETISELRLANETLNGVLGNTFAVYQSQLTHFRNLVSTPQQVNVGQPVAQALATIAQNTAQTATQVAEVKAAVVAGTGAVVSNNTAVSVNTADAIVDAVTSDASRWRESQNPDIRTARETVLIRD